MAVRDELAEVKRELVAVTGEIGEVTNGVREVTTGVREVTNGVREVTNGVVEVKRRLARVESVVSVREAMRMLECALCLDAARSKRAFSRLYNFDKFSAIGDATQRAALDAVLAAAGLDDDSVDAIGYLKDAASYDAVYSHGPATTVSEWESLLTAALMDSQSPFDAAVTAPALLQALKKYLGAPADPSAPWLLKEHYATLLSANAKPGSSSPGSAGA